MQLHPGNVNHYFIRVLNIGVNPITSSDKISDFFGAVQLLQLNGGYVQAMVSIGKHPRVNYAERSHLV